MAGTIPVPPQGVALLAWLAEHPDAVSEAIDVLNKLRSLQVRVAPTMGAAPSAAFGLLESDQNILLQIPIQFRTRIQSVTAGGTTDANCRATVDALVAALSSVGINP